MSRAVVPTPIVAEALERNKRWLLELPGCTAVGVSQKRVDGRFAGPGTAIAVFVKRKRRSLDHGIPPVIDGVPTDVIEREFDFRESATNPHQRYQKMFSGLAVTSWENPSQNGSIGCFIRTTGKAAAGTHPQINAGTYLLTNYHVLATADPNNQGDPRVIQPDNASFPPPGISLSGRFVDGYHGATADCAIASIDVSRSWSNSVPSGAFGSFNWLRGPAAAAANWWVYKYGATTGYTTARIHTINFNAGNVTNAIYIEQPKHTVWAAGGDSGSVAAYYYSNKIVGLNFREDTACPCPGGSYAGLAYPIQDQMNNFGGVVTLPWR